MAQGRVAVFDAHLHIIDPRFPLVASQGYVPEPFTVDDYRAAAAGINIVGGAVVAGSFQGGSDPPWSWLLDALARLGPAFVGVAQLVKATPRFAGDLTAVPPDKLLFGTDLPGTRARRRFAPAALERVAAIAPAALADNARAWYRPRV